MFRLAKLLGLVAVVAFVALGLGMLYARTTGLAARSAPGMLETYAARAIRSWSVSPAVRDRANPVAATPAALRAGMEHYADHCASCHANDGSGATTLGQSLFPPAPDMRSETTQRLTDGELFHVIERGIRFTGMPAWSTGTPDGEHASWELVHFIRRLPRLTADEIETMKSLNPRPPAEIRQEIEAERFLQGG